MNSEIYAALIEAGSSEEKARDAVVSVTAYEKFFCRLILDGKKGLL